MRTPSAAPAADTTTSWNDASLTWIVQLPAVLAYELCLLPGFLKAGMAGRQQPLVRKARPPLASSLAKTPDEELREAMRYHL